LHVSREASPDAADGPPPAETETETQKNENGKDVGSVDGDKNGKEVSKPQNEKPHKVCDQRDPSTRLSLPETISIILCRRPSASFFAHSLIFGWTRSVHLT
jgi:hypothetical protein